MGRHNGGGGRREDKESVEWLKPCFENNVYLVIRT
jgi:hypothetical protein